MLKKWNTWVLFIIFDLEMKTWEWLLKEKKYYPELLIPLRSISKILIAFYDYWWQSESSKIFFL